MPRHEVSTNGFQEHIDVFGVQAAGFAVGVQVRVWMGLLEHERTTICGTKNSQTGFA